MSYLSTSRWLEQLAARQSDNEVTARRLATVLDLPVANKRSCSSWWLSAGQRPAFSCGASRYEAPKQLGPPSGAFSKLYFRPPCTNKSTLELAKSSRWMQAAHEQGNIQPVVLALLMLGPFGRAAKTTNLSEGSAPSSRLERALVVAVVGPKRPPEL